MSLPSGARLGAYEVIASLGAGGMGEVYRARDTVLHRDIALKILPRSFAGDAERLSRFRREAQLLAALNHPNIAQIYGIEDKGDTPSLVLELVEGPTLADRIARGPIELREALQIATQIARALEAAHAQSIVHRDLKPANVKIRDDGTVKVLDFGLAKALAPDVRTKAADAMNSPTITNPGTAIGVILGTAAYMAPEQAKGKAVDKRADIWAFGVIAFEMLTGRRLFKGDDVSDTLAEVLKSEPDWNLLPASTPPAVRRLLRRCLVRDPRERLHDIGDARLEIEDALAQPADAYHTTDAGLGRRERSLWLAALVGVGALAALGGWYVRTPDVQSAPEMRVEIVTPSANPFSIAPNGQVIVYQGFAEGRPQLWLRSLETETARPLPGTEGPGGFLAWAPDSQSFLIAGPTLRQLQIDGGAAHAIPGSVRGLGFGISRNSEGVVLLAPANTSPLARVHMNGGKLEPATQVVAPQLGHRFPYFLPDGRHFLFLATGTPDVQGIYLGALGSLDARRLVEADTAAVFSPPDFIVFGRRDTLFAQRVHPRTFEPQGAPIRVADRVLQNRSVFGSVQLAASWTGTIAYRSSNPPRRRLVWLDRTGKEVGLVGGVEAVESSEVPLRISPDGRTIVVGRRVEGNSDLWTVMATPQGAVQRFTSDPALDSNAVWSPDGRQIAFQSARKGGGFYDLYVKDVGGTGEERVLLESTDNKTMHDWSRDGKYILFGLQGREQVPRDLWAIPTQGDRKPFPVTKNSFDEVSARFSPDSKWIAYQSNAAGGAFEIYVRPFPGPGREWRISTSGGTQPAWRADGGELYYVGRGNQLMAVPITLPESGDAIELGTALPLFAVAGIGTYAPAADGRKFLVNQILEDDPNPPIRLILNWRRQ